MAVNGIAPPSNCLKGGFGLTPVYASGTLVAADILLPIKQPFDAQQGSLCAEIGRCRCTEDCLCRSCASDASPPHHMTLSAPGTRARQRPLGAGRCCKVWPGVVVHKDGGDVFGTILAHERPGQHAVGPAPQVRQVNRYSRCAPRVRVCRSLRQKLPNLYKVFPSVFTPRRGNL